MRCARAGRKCPGFSDPSVGGGNFLSLLWKETDAGGGVGLPLLEILLSSPLYCALLSFDLALSFFFASAVYSRASFLIPLCKVRLRGKGDWVCCLSRFFSLAFFLLGLGTFATRERETERGFELCYGNNSWVGCVFVSQVFCYMRYLRFEK